MNSNPRFTDFVKSDFLHLELSEILQSSPSILLGVSDEAGEVLKRLQIFTVFDLGMSKFFIAAGAIASVSDILPNLIARYGRAPSEMVDDHFLDRDVRELLNEKVFVLKGVSSALARRISEELGVNTIREMALWNPYIIAKILIAACQFLRELITAVTYRIHTVLTDNGIQFTNRLKDEWAFKHLFDRICEEHGIEHRLTKVNHLWTNGQVERMNRTIKDATVKRYHYETHEQLKGHLAHFLAAYNFARRLKTLRGLTPYEHIGRCWQKEPERFRLNPHHQSMGLNN